MRQLLLAGVLVSGLITTARCLVTILTDGQGKNGSTVAVSVVMATDIIMIIVLLGYQYIVTIIPTSSITSQYLDIFLLVPVQPFSCIIIYISVCSTDGETEHRVSGGCVLIT